MVLQGAACVLVLATSLMSTRAQDICKQTTGWCHTRDGAHKDGYESYDMDTHCCILCDGTYTIKPRKDIPLIKCCAVGLLVEKCYEDELRCGDGGYFNASLKCDGVKNCVDGSDEAICFGEDKFSCNVRGDEQSILRAKVCDRAIDCFNSLDETNCSYFGGRCNGFRCTKQEQCVPANAICDGTKDCQDGTDESRCGGATQQTDMFECSQTQGDASIEMTKVCDGTKGCTSGEDEKNCFWWTQWTTWSDCDCATEEESSGLAGRTRCCRGLHTNAHVESECTGMSQVTRVCECTGGTGESLAMVIILPLTIILTILATLFVVHLVIRRKNALSSYSEATLSLANITSESIESPIMTEMVDYNAGRNWTPPKSFQGRRLPATPPGETSRGPDRFPSNQTGMRSLMSEENETVVNPLYRAYAEDNTNYHSLENGMLQVTPASASYESCSIASTGGQMDSDEVFDHHDDENADDVSRSTIMEQIEIAQMGNLIEVSDVRLKSLG